jgi:hypothetical protein
MTSMAEPSIKAVQRELQALREEVEQLKSIVGLPEDKRLAEIRRDPSIGKTEKELNAYLKKRGVDSD